MSATISPEVYNLLSDIFRLVVREVESADDKAKLAPGELGISYTEGAFYIRDPHTGELFSPNSVETIRKILSKYDPDTNLLNADYVASLRYYTSINQINNPGGAAMTCDTIIREMEIPSIAMLPIRDDHFKTLGFPARSGLLEIRKFSVHHVSATFLDSVTMVRYFGEYDLNEMIFRGWYAEEPITTTFTIANAIGTDALIEDEDLVIRDLSVLRVHAGTIIPAGSSLRVNDSDPSPIIQLNNEPLADDIPKGHDFLIVRDSLEDRWLYADNNITSTDFVIETLKNRINLIRAVQDANFESTANDIQILSDDVYDIRLKMVDLAKGLTDELHDQLSALFDVITSLDNRVCALEGTVSFLASNPGKILDEKVTFIVDADGTDRVVLAEFNPALDKIVVNYNQTVLREAIDYTISETGIQFTTFTLNAGDVLHFTVLKQAEGV